MTQQSPKELEASARKNLRALRESMNRFQRARMATEAASQGVVRNKAGLPPALVAQRVNDLRDLDTMRRAVNDLYELLEVLYRRQPTEAELVAGPTGNEALGNFALPSVPGGLQVLAGIGFGAWTLTSLFDYLRTREERIQQELGIPSDGQAPGRGLSVAAGVVGLALAGGGGYLAYRWWKGRNEEDDEDEEDDTTSDALPTLGALDENESGKQTPVALPPSEEEES